MGLSMATQALGGTVYVMERFDAADALDCIEGFRITHSQWGYLMQTPRSTGSTTPVT